jgi:hypothetical protein
MKSRKEIESDFSVPKEPEVLAKQRLSNAHGRKNRNSLEPALALDLEDWKIERLGNESSTPTQVIRSMSSYKPEKSVSSSDAPQAAQGRGLWDKAQANIRAEIGEPAHCTWIETSRFVALDGSVLTLAVSSAFNRDQILKRYGTCLRQTLSTITGLPITLKFVVDESLLTTESPSAAPIQALPSKRTPWAATQNPTNNPLVAGLLDQHGDARQVILHSKIFEKPCNEWGCDVAGLVSHVNKYTLERLLWAVEEAKKYRGTRSKGAFMTYILQNGMEGA